MGCEEIEKELEKQITNWNESKERIDEIDKIIDERLTKIEDDATRMMTYFLDDEIEALKKERETKKSWMNQNANRIVNYLKDLQDSGCELKNLKF